VRAAVDTEQDGGAERSAAAEEFDDGDVGGAAVRPLMAPAIDGELGGVVQFLGQGDAVHPSGEHAGALEGHQAVVVDGDDLGQRLFDACARVDSGEHRGEVLGQAQQPVGLQDVMRAESFAPRSITLTWKAWRSQIASSASPRKR
jgi:hypothetical protein